MTDYSLSISDLILVDGFKEAFAYADVDNIKLYLHQNGMDVDKEFDLVRRTHRNLRNQLVNGERYEGQERTDVAWVKSGYASLEAIIESEKDSNLRQTLREMSVTRQQEKVFD